MSSWTDSDATRIDHNETPDQFFALFRSEIDHCCAIAERALATVQVS